MIKNKGYSIWNGANKWERPNWHVGTLQDDGKMVVHASGYSSCLTAKRAADGHFGRL